MESLVKRKSIIKGQITKLLNYAKTCNEKSSVHDIKVRLDKLNEHYQEFVATEDDIFRIDATVASDMDAIDETYYAITAFFSRLLRPSITTPIQSSNDNNTTLNQSLTNPVSDYKLPRLLLPTFSGDPREWQSFFDIFKATVHENTTLTPAQKFQYLKGQLKGTAAGLVRHFRVEDANYIEAFQRLVKRFDRKRHIVNEFIDSFINQSSVKKSDCKSIVQLYDTCDEVVRGLKALGADAEKRDCWLIYLVEKKMDEASLQLWRQESSDVDFPSFSDLLEFLNKRINSLEGSSNSISDHRSRYKPASNVKTFHLAKAPPKCSLCPGQQHRLCDCAKFLQMEMSARREYMLQSTRCFNCLSDTHLVRTCNSKKVCRQCKRKHHTLLHPPPNVELADHQPSASPAALILSSNQPNQSDNNIPINLQSTNWHATDAILPTASVEIRDKFGFWKNCRVLLDSASTRSYITENCVNLLNLPRKKANFSISTINGGKSSSCKGLTNLVLRSKVHPNFTTKIDAYILPKITSNQPPQMFNLDHLDYLRHLQLADPKFNMPDKIYLLLGCDQFLSLLDEGRINCHPKLPTAQNTRLGWIVGGQINTDFTRSSTFLSTNLASDTDNLLRAFWEIEELPFSYQYTDEERSCIEHYNENTIFEPGKLTVSLPFKKDTMKLGNSLNQALRRFASIEQKLLGNQPLGKQYSDFLTEYETLGQMELIPANEINKPDHETFYLPHHPVLKEASTTTKLRVVFDASAKSQSGVSLNDKLMVGPTTQQTLLEILLRFRKHQYIFTADIEKMFRQIWMNKSDVDF